jgi:HlyD family secretion protein
MTRRRVVAIVAIVIVALGLVLAFRPAPLRVDLATVTRGPLTLSFEEQGRTELRHHYVIAAPAAGTLHRITLEQGDAVHAGDVVAQIDPSRAALLAPATRANPVAQIAAAAADIDAAAARLAAAMSAEADRRAADERRSALGSLLAQQGQGGGTTLDLQSPIDGVVLHRYVESAVPVAAGQQLLELGDPGDLDIEVDTLSQDAIRLRAGMAARVIRWGGDAPLEARVWRIEPGGFTKISALGVEEQRTRVRLDLTSPPAQWPHFGDAYRVEVEFLLAQGDDMLQVPSSALFRENGRYALYRVVDGNARKTFVDIGLRGASATQIQSGLKPGDVVVTHPDDRIADGVRVTAATP